MKSRFSRERRPGERLFQLAAWLPALLVLTGCRVTESAVRMPGQVVRAVSPGGQSEPTDLAALQVDLQRYADEYAGRTTAVLDSYTRNVGTAEARSQALRWKVAVNSAVVTIVTGPNPQINLLDGLTLATLTRMSLEQIVDKTDGGAPFEPWLAVSRDLEDYAWNHLATKVFNAEQRQELRDSLQRWWEANPSGHLTFIARPAESRSLIRQTAQGASRPGSVFALVGLDPTAGLDPAVREVTRTRLLAERLMFMTQRMPFLLRWHLELLTDDLLREDRTVEVLATTTRLTDSADRFSRAVESMSVTMAELPNRMSAERQAILEAFEAKEGTLRELAATLTRTLDAGDSMSESLNTTLITLDGLVKRFGVGEAAAPGQPADPKGEPFRILDYAQTATQLDGAARQLTVLLEALDQTLGSTNLAELSVQLGGAVEQAQAGGREVVDYAFWRAILLVTVVLAAALIYRWISGRLGSASRSRLL